MKKALEWMTKALSLLVAIALVLLLSYIILAVIASYIVLIAAVRDVFIGKGWGLAAAAASYAVIFTFIIWIFYRDFKRWQRTALERTREDKNGLSDY